MKNSQWNGNEFCDAMSVNVEKHEKIQKSFSITLKYVLKIRFPVWTGSDQTILDENLTFRSDLKHNFRNRIHQKTILSLGPLCQMGLI